MTRFDENLIGSGGSSDDGATDFHAGDPEYRINQGRILDLLGLG